MKVAVTCTHLQRDIASYRGRLESAGLDVVIPSIPGQELAGDDLIAAMQGVSGVIAGDDQFSRDVLLALPDLAVISKWGIGLDGVDLGAAAELGKVVTNTPGMFNDEVAEQALGYLIALVRGQFLVDRGVRNGQWPKPVGRSLGSLRAGVIGLGNIGRSLAEKLDALGLSVRGSDPSPEAASWASENNVELLSALDLAVASDVILVTCPLNEHTRAMIDSEFVSAMPSGSWFINVGRGPVAVGSVIVEALESGHLAGAALDVFEEEPLVDPAILAAPNLILGSHNASNTLEACNRTHEKSIENLLNGLGL